MPKVEHPHVFAMRLVSKHFGLCSKVRGAAICERITIPTAMIDDITARDAAIRAESAELLRVCGEALKAMAEPGTVSWGEIKRLTQVALAALKDAGVQ